MGLEKMGLDEPGLIRALGAFGGGIASTGRTCGCLTGGVAAISRLFSKSKPGEKEDPAMWSLSYKLSKAFEELAREHGSTDCRDIAGVNWGDKDQVRKFYGDPESRMKTVCRPLVGETAFALGELLERVE